MCTADPSDKPIVQAQLDGYRDASEEAEGQVEEIDAWWRAHRLAAPDLFTGELAQALPSALIGAVLAVTPLAAAIGGFVGFVFGVSPHLTCSARGAIRPASTTVSSASGRARPLTSPACSSAAT